MGLINNSEYKQKAGSSFSPDSCCNIRSLGGLKSYINVVFIVVWVVTLE
jgi:hypothetical protein